jgi:hypothetical protein
MFSIENLSSHVSETEWQVCIFREIIILKVKSYLVCVFTCIFFSFCLKCKRPKNEKGTNMKFIIMYNESNMLVAAICVWYMIILWSQKRCSGEKLFHILCKYVKAFLKWWKLAVTDFNMLESLFCDLLLQDIMACLFSLYEYTKLAL